MHVETFRAFWRDEEGATAVEYGLIVALMTLVMIVGLTNFSEAMEEMYVGSEGSIAEALQGNAGNGG